MKQSLTSIGAMVLIAASLGLTACNTAKTGQTAIPTVHAQTETFSYQDFDTDTYNTLRGKEAFSLFFHSKSCGTCAKKNKEIISEANDFDSGTILKIEYSNAPQELIEEFGVAKYDTFVNFDAEGNATTVKGALVDDVRDAI